MSVGQATRLQNTSPINYFWDDTDVCRSLTFLSMLPGGRKDPEVLAIQKQEPGESTDENKKRIESHEIS